MKKPVQFLIIGILTGILVTVLGFVISDNSLANTSISYLPTPIRNHIIESKPISNLIKGKIGLNNATQEELISLPGIGEAKANSIIAFRQKYGDLASIDEILYVIGIGPSLYTSIKEYIYIED